MRGLAFSLGDQPLGEERLKRRREQSHGASSRQPSSRRPTSCEQLGHRLQVPVRAAGCDVPEERGEQRQLAVDVLAGAMPVQQRADSKRMPEVVRAGSGALPAPSRPTSRISCGNPCEPPVVEPLAGRVTKNAVVVRARQVAGRAGRAYSRSASVVRRVHRHLALLVLFAGRTCSAPSWRSTSSTVEPERLRRASGRWRPSARSASRTSRRAAAASAPGGRHQRRDLLLGVDVWRHALLRAGSRSAEGTSLDGSIVAR